jgi:hypothetical protein
MFVGSIFSASTERDTAFFGWDRIQLRRSFRMAVCSMVLLGAASLSACAADHTAAAPGYTAPVNPTLQSVTDAVRADASQRTGLDVAKLEIQESVAVTWADGSLGCPQPGMTYTMALVPGYRIRIKVDEQLLNYHASARGHWVFCPVGRAVDPAPRDAV